MRPFCENSYINDKLVEGLGKKKQAITFFSFIYKLKCLLHFTFGMTVHGTSIKNYEGKHHSKYLILILNVFKL